MRSEVRDLVLRSEVRGLVLRSDVRDLVLRSDVLRLRDIPETRGPRARGSTRMLVLNTKVMGSTPERNDSDANG